MAFVTKTGLIACLLLSGILDHWMQVSPSTGIAFVDVNVIPMDRERILHNQTVLIQKDRIQRIGNSSQVQVPDGISKISGNDLYLMPGLVDMHVHLHSKADALLFLANGVTTVRNMRGTPLHLAWKPLIESGKLLAPSIYSCGPILDGAPASGENVTVVETKEEIEQTIQNQKELGFDCIKVYNRLSPDAYATILKTAHSYNLPVAGHVPFSVGLSGALAMGQNSIEHLTGYMKALRVDPNKAVIDEHKIRELAEKTQKAGIWNCPTLVVVQKMTESGEDFERLTQQPEIKYVAPSRLAIWNPSKSSRFQSMGQEDFEGARRGLQVLNQLTLALQKHGGRILLGTDSPSFFVVPGFSAHQELSNLAQAGLSPFEAIQTGTKNPAEFLNASNEFGTVQQGKRADLILVKCNPLKNISCTKQIAGVMVRGEWLPEKTIQQMLSDVVQSYEVPKNRFANLPDLPKDASFTAEYEITFNDVVVGAERFALIEHNGIREVIGQQTSDPPLDATYLLNIRSSTDNLSVNVESTRPEGVGRLSLTLAQHIAKLEGSLPYQKDLQHAEISMPDGNYLDGSFMAMKTLIENAFLKLSPGEEQMMMVKELDFGIYVNKGLELQDMKWTVLRDADEKGLRNFTIQMEWQHQKAAATISLDQNGMPVFYQRGARSFRQLRK